MDIRNQDSASDTELVEQAKTNIESFALLVDRYQQRLFYFIKRISYCSKEDIEDIIQETFIKVYKNLNDYDPTMSFSTWLYQIARNSMIDAIRKQKARPSSVQLDDNEIMNIFKSTTNLEKEMIGKDSLLQVKKIIDDLPYAYKEVIVLKCLEEKSYEEIMDIIKKPKGTVAALISRGRKMIVEEAKRRRILT